LKRNSQNSGNTKDIFSGQDRNHRFHKKVYGLKRKSIKKKIYLLIQMFFHNCSLWQSTSVILTKRNIIFILFASQTSVLICHYLGVKAWGNIWTRKDAKKAQISTRSQKYAQKRGRWSKAVCNFPQIHQFLCRHRSSFNDSSSTKMKVKISLESIFQFGFGLRFPES